MKNPPTPVHAAPPAGVLHRLGFPGAVLAGVLLLAGLVASGCTIRDHVGRNFLNPYSRLEILPEEIGLVAEPWSIDVDETVLTAWFFDAPKSRDLVIVYPGNSGNMSVYLPFVAPMLDADYDVLLFDYRGFGLSDGTPDLFALFDDAEKVLAYAREKTQADSVTLLGLSLGSVVSVVTASRHPDSVDALVLDSTFSPREMAKIGLGKFLGTLAFSLFVPSEWRIEKRYSDLQQPLLLIHGTADRITPVRTAVSLFQRLDRRRRQLWLIDEVGHVPGAVGALGPVYFSTVRHFLDHFIKGAPSPLVDAAFEQREERKEIRISRRGEGEASGPVQVILEGDDGALISLYSWIDGMEGTLNSASVAKNHRILGAVSWDADGRSRDAWTAEVPPHVRRRQRLRDLYERFAEVFPDSPVSLLRVAMAGRQMQWDSEQRRWNFVEIDFDPYPRCQALVDPTQTLVEELPAHLDRRSMSLLAQVGACFEVAGAGEEAEIWYRRALEKAPADPFTFILYDDGSWSRNSAYFAALIWDRIAAVSCDPEIHASAMLESGDIRARSAERRARRAVVASGPQARLGSDGTRSSE